MRRVLVLIMNDKDEEIIDSFTMALLTVSLLNDKERNIMSILTGVGNEYINRCW